MEGTGEGESEGGGRQPCVVCGDAATGLHYLCFTCEGCKGFFRRTIQKNLEYQCKGTGDCPIDKGTRNHCQNCRFKKCISVGMATNLVLNEDQRLAKRQLIMENRERKMIEKFRADVESSRQFSINLTQESIQDPNITQTLTNAYVKYLDPQRKPAVGKEIGIDEEGSGGGREERVEEMVVPHIERIVAFAESISPFHFLNERERVDLVKKCWMEMILLNVALQFDPIKEILMLPCGRQIGKEAVVANGGRSVLGGIYQMGRALARVQLDNTEAAIVAALLLLNPENGGENSHSTIEEARDQLLSALSLYSSLQKEQLKRQDQILLALVDFRALCMEHSEELLNSNNVPVLREIVGSVSPPPTMANIPQ